MRKMLLSAFAVLLFLSGTAFGQWSFSGEFPVPGDTLPTNTGVQFVAVDPDGKVWIDPYRTNNDSLYVPDSLSYQVVRPIYVFNADGTPANLTGSGIEYDAATGKLHAVTVDGTLKPFYWSKYGIDTDHEGNILVNDYNELFRVNYMTGEGMNHLDLSTVIGQTNPMCKPAVAENGDIYLVFVLPGVPIVVLNPDFTFKMNAVDTIFEYGRTADVSMDGNTIYVPRFSKGTMDVYNRADEFSMFELSDSLLGVSSEATKWGPNGNLWVSAGSYQAPVPAGSPYTNGTYYAFDVTDWSIQDSIKWNFYTAENPDERNRGIAFYDPDPMSDGMVAYLVCFGSSTYPPVQKHENPTFVTGVEEQPDVVVTDFNLSQNYPNPFNPTTQIDFTLPDAGFTSLKIYDMLGREVATLVNEDMTAGAYTVDFDASNLSSGTYVYQLVSGSTKISKKMVLMK